MLQELFGQPLAMGAVRVEIKEYRRLPGCQVLRVDAMATIGGYYSKFR
jgi:hypothetical protein